MTSMADSGGVYNFFIDVIKWHLRVEVDEASEGGDCDDGACAAGGESEGGDGERGRAEGDDWKYSFFYLIENLEVF